MDTYYVFFFGSKKPERIVVPKVGFPRKRQFTDIFEGFDVLGSNSGGFEILPVKRNIVIDQLYALLKAF